MRPGSPARVTASLTLVIALTGCGSADLTGPQQEQLAHVDAAFARAAPDNRYYAQVFHGAPFLIDLCRHKRDVEWGGKTVKEHLEDDADMVRTTVPVVARELDRAVARNCS